MLRTNPDLPLKSQSLESFRKSGSLPLTVIFAGLRASLMLLLLTVGCKSNESTQDVEFGSHDSYTSQSLENPIEIKDLESVSDLPITLEASMPRETKRQRNEKQTSA